MEPAKTPSISPNTMITNTQNNTQPENYITQRQADVLDQTRLRALRTVLRYCYGGKIVSLHLSLENRGKTHCAVSNQRAHRVFFFL
jgi:hypothetical protein